MSEPPEKPRYSFIVKAANTVTISGPLAANMSWDGWCRLIYERANLAIQAQANELALRGNVTMAELQNLVEVQRNGLVVKMRKPLTPFGRLYSEVLKPAAGMQIAEQWVGCKAVSPYWSASAKRAR